MLLELAFNYMNTLEQQIDLLIKMQKDNDKRIHGNGGAQVNGKWLVFREELEKLEALFLSRE